MYGALIAALFLVGWLGHELFERRQHGLRPGGMLELWRLAQRKTNPDFHVVTLIFVSVACFIFSFWESFLRFLLGQEVGFFSFFLGVALMTLAIYVRRLAFTRGVKLGKHLRLDDLLLLFVGFCVLSRAWYSLLLFTPWLYFRARYLGGRIFRQRNFQAQ